MGYIKNPYPRTGGMVILFSVLLIFGCAANNTAKKEIPFEKWATMAETQSGYSPSPRDRSKSIVQEFIQETGEVGEQPLTPTLTRELPTQLITLKLRQADIKTVLRSLAQIVDRNLLVKSEIKGEMTIDFRDVPWNQAFNGILRTQGLTYVWEGDIIRVITLEDMEQDLKRKTQEMGNRQVAPLLTVVVPIDFITSDKLSAFKESLETFLTKNKDDKSRGSVRVDEHSNSLIISAIKEDLLKMMSIIEKIDKPTPQIQIKANIVETTKETARSLGIQWGGMYAHKVGNDNLWITPGGTGGTTTNSTATGYTPVYGSTGLSGQGYGVNFPVATDAMTAVGGAASLGLMIGQIGGNILDLQLTALQQDGKLNILSSPSITTLDNQTAYTNNGESIPVVTTSTGSSGSTSNTVTYKDAVLRLEIKPHVIDGRNLKMEILVTKDEVDTTRTVDGNPFIIKKETKTSLIVQDGETIVISGLTKQRNSQISNGIPGLKDIPVLGWLFKGDDKAEKMEEVLIFITPKILPAAIAATKTAGEEHPAGTGAGEKANEEKRPGT